LLEIVTFGGLTIYTDGVKFANLRSRKVEALLVYVASNEQPQSRSSLANLFWGDRGEKRALANLRVALSDLRKHLGDYLIISRDTVGLNPQTSIRLDAHELISAFDSEDFTRVISLYGGGFLQGFFVSNCPQFESWVTSEADRYRRFTKDALHELIQQSIMIREYDDGLVHCQQALTLDPLDESTHRALMRLYVHTDQRNLALIQFTT
jgi:DNA-binding SARP family transcriptional activator